jgi:tellurite resistance protein TerC
MSNLFIYSVFGIIFLSGLVVDMGFFSKKNAVVGFKSALIQTFFWVVVALGFFIFLWIEKDKKTAIEYISAYLMEWSLSVDNIFVFIIIFTSFNVKEKFYGRTLLIGILMAIFFRFIFITLGIELLQHFHWFFYLLGAFLLFTGYKLFFSNNQEEVNPQEFKVYTFLSKYLPLVNHDGNGKYMIKENGKPVYTTLFVVVVLLGVIDLLFALDSIPAVMGISTQSLIIYSSNIFALLGLRSLFFLLRKEVSKFDYLQQGIAVVLIVIGGKMLASDWLKTKLDEQFLVILSLLIIVICIFGSILYSIFKQKKGLPKDIQ